MAAGFGVINGDGKTNEVKLKAVFNGQVLVSYIHLPITYEKFGKDIRQTCQLPEYEICTLKWMDNEGDPCTLSCERELTEALRLYELNGDYELTVHVFLGTPSMPGMPCAGEDKTVYRRGARRWKKFYRVNGHKFQAKRFNRRVQCMICGEHIWGLGRAGYRCVDCRLAVHKSCHRYIKQSCTGEPIPMVVNAVARRSSQDPTYRSFSWLSLFLILTGLYCFSFTPAHYTLSENSGFLTEFDFVAPFHSNSAFDADSNLDVPVGVNEPVNGYMPAAPSSSQISLDDFKLLTVIGRGSYAKVLQVEYKKTGQIYAMKVIKKQMFLEDEDIDWVQTEKSVFETASNHPFLVGLHSCFQTPGRLFFVIEFVPGGDLMFHMQQKRKLPEEHARFYSTEIVLALHFLHSRAIIYRDMKLDNVLIDAEGHIKLTDYGMCKEGIYPGDKTSTFCGTPNYIAPEILRGDEYSYSVDWWALGVLMFEMMAGRSPFDVIGNMNDPAQHTEDYLFQIILEKQIRIPRALSVKASQVLQRFLDKEPTNRLGCDLNLEQALDDIKTHAFFRTVDWEAMEQRQIAPPHKPTITNERDLNHFDTAFTDESPTLTPDEPSVLDKIDQSEFDGFEYINPLLMSKEDAV